MNREYIDNFFNYLNNIYDYNKNINSNFTFDCLKIYTILVNYGVKENENIERLFNIWIDRFKTRPGIKVFKSDSNYYCQFIHGNIDIKKSIKLYIPLGYHNMDLNVTKIFEFIRSNNIEHYSKVSKTIRNDDVIIRVGSQKDAMHIIDFINSCESIKKELLSVSPLTFNYNGIGIVKDDVKSYNYEISKVISTCLNKKMKLNTSMFSNYLKQKSLNENNSIYNVASMILKGTNLDDICKLKLNNKSNDILLKIMHETKEKYGVQIVKKALYEYISNNNPYYFTRGNDKSINLRDELMVNLSSNDVLELINVHDIKDIENGITKFVNMTYVDDLSIKKEKENEIQDSLLDLLSEKSNVPFEIKKIINQEFKNKKIDDILCDILVQVYPNNSLDEIKKQLEEEINNKNGTMINTIINLVNLRK